MRRQSESLCCWALHCGRDRSDAAAAGGSRAGPRRAIALLFPTAGPGPGPGRPMVIPGPGPVCRIGGLGGSGAADERPSRSSIGPPGIELEMCAPDRDSIFEPCCVVFLSSFGDLGECPVSKIAGGIDLAPKYETAADRPGRPIISASAVPAQLTAPRAASRRAHLAVSGDQRRFQNRRRNRRDDAHLVARTIDAGQGDLPTGARRGVAASSGRTLRLSSNRVYCKKKQNAFNPCQYAR